MKSRLSLIRAALPLLALGTVTWACSPTPSGESADSEAGSESAVTAAAVDEAAVRAEIDRLRDGFEEFVSTLDMTIAEPMIAEGAVMVPPAGNGWNEMLAAGGDAPYPAGSSIEITPIETVVIDGEWAYEMGTSVFTWTPEGADEPVELRDTYLILLRNQGDGWKIWREVASANMPPDAM